MLPRGGKRPGAGKARAVSRPANLTVTVERNVADNLDDMARRQGLSRSELVRVALTSLAGSRRPRSRRSSRRY